MSRDTTPHFRSNEDVVVSQPSRHPGVVVDPREKHSAQFLSLKKSLHARELLVQFLFQFSTSRNPGDFAETFSGIASLR
jgi:hypothetical protein